jgi:hypothetical protein
VNDIYDNVWDELAKAIIKQAVDDWRTLIRVEKRVLLMPGRKISLMEIRRFFRSDYCQSLMGGDPLIILEQLEKELKESRKKGSLI